MALERLRGRMPVLAFILLAVVCLALIGLVCACFDDQFAQTFDRSLQAQPAVIEVWPVMTVLALAMLALTTLSVAPTGRGSPALLQRFLF